MLLSVLFCWHLFLTVFQLRTDLKVSIKLAVSDKDSTDALLKKLKRCCNQTGHLRELRFKDHWESAAEKKKRKSAQARIRRRFERANERFLKLARGDSEYDT